VRKAGGISVQTPAPEAPLDSGTLLVSDHVMFVLAPGGIWLHLPGDVSPWMFGMIDGVVHNYSL